MDSVTGYPSLSSLTYQSGNVITTALKNFYLNNLHTDVVFRVQCGSSFISFPCHKLVLSLRSPVFADEFFGSNKTSKTVIEVEDIPPSAFETLIKYCYGIYEELQSNRGDVNFILKVFKAAKIYEIEPLRALCFNMFSAAVPTVDNVFELLDAALLTGSESLKLRCHKVLQEQTATVLSSHDVFNVTPAVINTILSMPILSLNSEYELLEWLFDWGSYTCTKYKNMTFQAIMAPYLAKVNITSLTAVEFGMLVQKYRNFFSETEAFSIFMHIVCPDCAEKLPAWFTGTKITRSFSQ